MIWVLDASVAVRWFLADESHPHADSVLASLVARPGRFAVPELFTYEVFAVLQRLHPDALAVFRQAILPLLHSGLLRQPMTESLAVMADAFVKEGLTGYDACYAALAKDLKGCWLTFDGKAHRCIQQLRLSCDLSEQLPPGWD